MTQPPDFYLYELDANRDIGLALRSCRVIGTTAHSGRTVTLARIDPPIPPGLLPHAVSTSIVGFAPLAAKPLAALNAGDVVRADLYEIYDLSSGKLAVADQPGIGRGTLYKTRPAIASNGRVMKPPAAAQAFVASITRALESGDKK
jgi:hypothetical protein